MKRSDASFYTSNINDLIFIRIFEILMISFTTTCLNLNCRGKRFFVRDITINFNDVNLVKKSKIYV